MRKYLLALTALLVPAFLSVPAYASSGSLDEANPGDIVIGGLLDFLKDAMDNLVGVMGMVWLVMTSNPLFLVFLGVSLFSVGIWLFRKVRNASKR